MEHETDKIHVMPVGGQWEVETQNGDPLTQAPSAQEAIGLARDLAAKEGVATVILHDGDGVTEEVPVPSPKSQPKTKP